MIWLSFETIFQYGFNGDKAFAKSSAQQMRECRNKKMLVKKARVKLYTTEWNSKRQKSTRHDEDLKQKETNMEATSFPPSPLSEKTIHTITSSFCEKTSAKHFEEAGCAMCGQLTVLSTLVAMSDSSLDMDCLHAQYGTTCKEQHKESQSIEDLDGPVLASTCKNVCLSCVKVLSDGKLPFLALANGL